MCLYVDAESQSSWLYRIATAIAKFIELGMMQSRVMHACSQGQIWRIRHVGFLNLHGAFPVKCRVCLLWTATSISLNKEQERLRIKYWGCMCVLKASDTSLSFLWLIGKIVVILHRGSVISASSVFAHIVHRLTHGRCR